MIRKLPKLHFSKGEYLISISDITIGEDPFIIPKGSTFFIEDIIGYGYNLILLNSIENNYIRIINSDMINYFNRTTK